MKIHWEVLPRTYALGAIPAQAGIQSISQNLDPRSGRGWEKECF